MELEAHAGFAFMELAFTAFMAFMGLRKGVQVGVVSQEKGKFRIVEAIWGEGKIVQENRVKKMWMLDSVSESGKGLSAH